MSKFVTIHHPEAGTARVPEKSLRIWQRSGWFSFEGAEHVLLPSAGGDVLTTATVFPPETFDAEPGTDPDE